MHNPTSFEAIVLLAPAKATAAELHATAFLLTVADAFFATFC